MILEQLFRTGLEEKNLECEPPASLKAPRQRKRICGFCLKMQPPQGFKPDGIFIPTGIENLLESSSFPAFQNLSLASLAS
ncbi:hypothetical protein [Desulfonatronum thiosulfatophilum]|uniref:hypothetical protein n=1 Tax=Desulfonatronum thiosulfatophilum TaxID=617002 RepID=UPI000B843958|nr:hypothetical protein [Desulfonatronum thiosulfatophilum]